MNDQIMKMLSAPDIHSFGKILCVQPHPDDNEIGMGGIIAYLTKRGCIVDYLTVTNGDLGDIGLTPEGSSLAEVRRKEAIASGKILGVREFHWFNYPDGSLADIPGLAGEIAKLLRREQYDAVFAPDPWLMYEAHQDHIITGKAVAQAGIGSSLRTYPRGTTTPPCELKGIGFYFTSAPNTIIDTTPYFEQKLTAMAEHKSQLPQELLLMYRTYFELQGKKLSQSESIGEGVKILAPLHLHCFVDGQYI